MTTIAPGIRPHLRRLSAPSRRRATRKDGMPDDEIERIAQECRATHAPLWIVNKSGPCFMLEETTFVNDTMIGGTRTVGRKRKFCRHWFADILYVSATEPADWPSSEQASA